MELSAKLYQRVAAVIAEEGIAGIRHRVFNKLKGSKQREYDNTKLDMNGSRSLARPPFAAPGKL